MKACACVAENVAGHTMETRAAILHGIVTLDTIVKYIPKDWDRKRRFQEKVLIAYRYEISSNSTCRIKGVSI